MFFRKHTPFSSHTINMSAQVENNVQVGCTVVVDGVSYVKLATGQLAALAAPGAESGRVAKKSSASPSSDGIQLHRLKSKRVPLVLPTDPYQAAAKVMALNQALSCHPQRRCGGRGSFMQSLRKAVSRPGEQVVFGNVPVYVTHGHYALYHRSRTIELCKADVNASFQPQPHTFVEGRKYWERHTHNNHPYRQWKCTEVRHGLVEGQIIVSLIEVSDQGPVAQEVQQPPCEFKSVIVQKSDSPTSRMWVWGCVGLTPITREKMYAQVCSTDEIDPIQELADACRQ